MSGDDIDIHHMLNEWVKITLIYIGWVDTDIHDMLKGWVEWLDCLYG